MGNDIEKEINEIIVEVLGFNNNEKICNQEVKEKIIIKLEEAKFWIGKIVK